MSSMAAINRVVRWPGLLGFLLVVGALLLGTMVFASALVKSAIEYTGTAMVGARVEVGQVDLSLSPLGFHLHGLQVTDPDAPMINAFEIDDIDFFLDTAQLLQMRTVIHEMQMKRLRVKTPRQQSGAILRETPPVETPQAAAGKDNGKLDFPVLQQIDVADIFGREELQSVQHLNRVRAELKQDEDVWSSKVASLPNGHKLEHYRGALAQLKFNSSGNALQDAQQLQKLMDDADKLRGEISADIDNVDAAWRDLRAMVENLRLSLQQFAALPQQDLDRLQAKYSLSAAGLANISDLLFGAKVRDWVSQALAWYVKLMPIFERFENSDSESAPSPRRSRGVDVRFPERGSVPDFLVHRASVSMELQIGKISGEVRNLSSDQSVLGHPLTFNFFSKEMQGVKDIEIVGTLNHVDARHSTDSVSIKARSITARDIGVLKSDQFPLRLAKVEMDLESNVELVGNNIGSKMNVAFRDADFVVPFKSQPGRIAEAMAAALAGVNAFATQITLSGTVGDFGLSVKSDLDELLRKAIGDQVAKAGQELRQKIKAQLDQRIEQPMAQVREQLAKFEELARTSEHQVQELQGMRDQVAARYRELEQSYKAKADAAGDKLRQKTQDEKQGAKDTMRQQKKKLKDEMQDKLGR